MNSTRPVIVLTHLDTRALEVMRDVEINFRDREPTLDDYVLETPTIVLPRPAKLRALVHRASKPEPLMPSLRISWKTISIMASLLTFAALACVAALSG